MKRKIWEFIHGIFKIPVFEKLLLPFTSGKYADTFMMRFVPPFHTYSNPTYRVAKKGALRLHANMYDYNDWKAFWGIKEHERENLYKLAEKSKTVVDVGTNNGWLLINMANMIAQNGGFVYGFEPFPDTYKRCIKNIKSSNITNTEVFNMGCGETESTFEMEVILESNSGQNRIVEKSQRQPGKKTQQVTVTTLDKQLSKLKKIDLIKIDVEGFELHVLKGAHNILQNHHPVLFMEINEPLLKDNHTSPYEVLKLLKHDYHYRIVNANTGDSIDEMGNFGGSQFDVICYPAEISHQEVNK
jgi:FkbM family methyltransferase